MYVNYLEMRSGRQYMIIPGHMAYSEPTGFKWATCLRIASWIGITYLYDDWNMTHVNPRIYKFSNNFWLVSQAIAALSTPRGL